MVAAMLFLATTGRTILPTFKLSRAANVPGRRPIESIELEWAEPGVKKGR